MTRLELAIAWRYLRSRRGSKLLSLISVIAILGVTVAVSALIVIIGVMNGLQNDLREKILIGSPDIQSLADLANSFEVVKSMQLAPISRDAVLRLVGATLAPVVPLALTMMSLEELLKKLLGILF